MNVNKIKITRSVLEPNVESFKMTRKNMDSGIKKDPVSKNEGEDFEYFLKMAMEKQNEENRVRNR